MNNNKFFEGIYRDKLISPEEGDEHICTHLLLLNTCSSQILCTLPMSAIGDLSLLLDSL